MNDPNFEKAANEYIESALLVEKEKYNPSSLKPFATQAAQIRGEMEKALYDFYTNFSAGYSVFSKQGFTIDFEKVNSDQLNQKLEEGESLQKIFGISDETLNNLYGIACNLYEEKRFEEAKNAFYFLTCLTPNIQQIWMGLGQTYCELQQYDEAIKNLLHAITLDRTNIDAYLSCLHALYSIHDVDKAKTVCEEGISFCEEHNFQELNQMLHEAKEVIKR